MILDVCMCIYIYIYRERERDTHNEHKHIIVNRQQYKMMAAILCKKHNNIVKVPP